MLPGPTFLVPGRYVLLRRDPKCEFLIGVLLSRLPESSVIGLINESYALLFNSIIFNSRVDNQRL